MFIDIRNVPSGNGTVDFLQNPGAVTKLDALNSSNSKGFSGGIVKRDNQVLCPGLLNSIGLELKQLGVFEFVSLH